MSRFSTSPAGRSLGLGFLLVSSVTLITFVFSFLGTILCGAVVGMMAGSSRRWRWSFLPVSLVFPGAMIASLQVSKSELAGRESVWLPVVCFGIFWITYLLTLALLHFEKPGEPLSAQAAPRQAQGAIPAAPEKGADETADGRHIEDAAPATAGGPPPEPAWEELQGTWTSETTGPDGCLCRKVFEVTRANLVLSRLDLDGQVRLLCRGAAKLEQLGPFKVLKVLGPQPGSPAASTGESGCPWTWIYRVSGPTLALASNLEETARGGDPAIELFVRNCKQPARAFLSSNPQPGQKSFAHGS